MQPHSISIFDVITSNILEAYFVLKQGIPREVVVSFLVSSYHLPRLSNGLEGFGRPSGQPVSQLDLSQLIVKGEKNEKVDDDDDDVHEKDIVRDR